jgi:uncharacterized protein (TIGR03382 family)
VSPLRTALAFATVVAVTPGAARAAVRTWDGGDRTTGWSAAANWSDDVVPAPGDDVVFDATSAKNAFIDADVRGIASLTISGYAGAIAADTLVSHALSISGDFVQRSGTFQPPVSLIVGGRFDEQGGTFVAGGGTVFLTARESETHRLVGVRFNNLSVSDGLLAYWTLDVDGRDVSGGGTDLRTEGSPAPHAGAMTAFANAGGLDLTGNEGLATPGPYPPLLRTPTWTVSLWFRPGRSFWDTGSCGGRGAVGPASELFSAGGDYFLRACNTTADGTNHVRLQVRTPAGSKDCVSTNSFAVDNFVYHHVAAVSNGSLRTIVLDGQATVCGIAGDQAYAFDALKLGRHEVETGYDLDGTLDEVRIYNRALTMAELQPLVAGQHPGPPAAARQTVIDPLVVGGDLVIASRVLALSQRPQIAGEVRIFGGGLAIDATPDAAPDAGAPADAPATADGPGAPPIDGRALPDGPAPLPDAPLPSEARDDDDGPARSDATVGADAAPPAERIQVDLRVGCSCGVSDRGRPGALPLLVTLFVLLRRRNRREQ